MTYTALLKLADIKLPAKARGQFVEGENQNLAQCFVYASKEQGEARAQLIAHALNKLDTALNALRKIQAIANGDVETKSDTHAINACGAVADDALSNAENVQV